MVKTKKINLKNKQEDKIYFTGFHAGYEQGVLGALEEIDYDTVDNFEQKHPIDYTSASDMWADIKEKIAKRLLK